MTFNEAMLHTLKPNGYVRHPGMGKGCTIGMIQGIVRERWNVNPNAGAEYEFRPSATDMARVDWYHAGNKRDS